MHSNPPAPLAAIAAALVFTACCAMAAAQEARIGHWPLDDDANGAGPHGLTTIAADLQFADSQADAGVRRGAYFNGSTSLLRVPHSSELALGTGDFTVSAWVKVDAELADVPGDVLSKFDQQTRTGFVLSIVNNFAAMTGPSNVRQVQFGIDQGRIDDAWADCGRPGEAVIPYGLVVHDGQLYTGTCEAGADRTGHVYRYLGDRDWEDCGAPDGSNTVSALASWRGELYAGTSRYRLRGSALPDSENQTPGGAVFRYAGGDEWVACGQLGEGDATSCLVVYRGRLYASTTYHPGVYRYEGGTTWTPIGTPQGRRVEAMTVFEGALFGGAYDGGEVYRYTPESGWDIVGELPDTTQTYGFAIFGDRLYVSTWPSATVFRYEGPGDWTPCGRLGEEREVMGMAVYNGSLYAGTLPLAHVYRYEGESQWTSTGALDLTPDVRYRRAWSMAVFQGRLYCGVLPSGHVRSLQAGRVASYDHALSPGWHHLAGARRGGELELFVDGQLAARSDSFNADEFNLKNDTPLLIGAGPSGHFQGFIRDVRLHGRALSRTDIEGLAGR